MQQHMNMGVVDRWLRLFAVAPIAVIFALVVGPTTTGGIILFVVAGVMVATSLTGYCPAYTLIRITTHRGLHRAHRSHLRAHHA